MRRRLPCSVRLAHPGSTTEAAVGEATIGHRMLPQGQIGGQWQCNLEISSACRVVPAARRSRLEGIAGVDVTPIVSGTSCDLTPDVCFLSSQVAHGCVSPDGVPAAHVRHRLQPDTTGIDNPVRQDAGSTKAPSMMPSRFSRRFACKQKNASCSTKRRLDRIAQGALRNSDVWLTHRSSAARRSPRLTSVSRVPGKRKALDLAQPDASLVGGTIAVLDGFRNVWDHGVDVADHDWDGDLAIRKMHRATFAAGRTVPACPLAHGNIGGLNRIHCGRLQHPRGPAAL